MNQKPIIDSLDIITAFKKGNIAVLRKFNQSGWLIDPNIQLDSSGEKSYLSLKSLDMVTNV
jgi:hypothetical protein